MLKYYSIDWQDVVRQCYDALRCSLDSRSSPGETMGDQAQHGNLNPGRIDLLPQALLLDQRLTPLERNTWQILRWLIEQQGISMPQYQDLQPYLATSPCGGLASRETVARALNVLRTTRWLTLVERARDEQGCLRGCQYVLHDEPLSAAEAVDRDKDYLGLIQRNLSHANRGIRNVAKHALAEIQADPNVPCEVVKAVQQLAMPAAQQVLSLKPAEAPDASERSEMHRVQKPQSTGAYPEPGPQAAVLADVRNTAPGRTVQQDQSKKSTVPLTLIDATTRWSDSLKLSPAEQRMAVQALRQLEPEQREAVISEAVVRCARGDIRKPVAYLMGLVKRACQGEFTLWAGRAQVSPDRSAQPASPPPQPAAGRASPAKDRAVSPLAQACLQELKRRCHVATGT
ncbi:MULTISPECIES: STY4528 family pathogenicity island replication protein [unclassified Pseudomonas]|uniref:STY4528 family pathogenicity island replication protein n=1 Tax=unclassified Pseudomonas TaxID=196821 RepID=UPI0025E55AAF|nr:MULTISPECIES: STY4528 family pathogenicity island replication protein [unclassified Pseudomonas]